MYADDAWETREVELTEIAPGTRFSAKEHGWWTQRTGADRQEERLKPANNASPRNLGKALGTSSFMQLSKCPQVLDKEKCTTRLKFHCDTPGKFYHVAYQQMTSTGAKKYTTSLRPKQTPNPQ